MIRSSLPTVAGPLCLRPAKTGDRDFTLRLYIASTRPYLPPEPDPDRWLRRRFADVYRRSQSSILCLNGAHAGWLQFEEARRSFILRQIHLVEEYRGQGIGTALLHELVEHAASQGKDVALRVMKGNPAQALYARLGFETVRTDDLRVHMRWQAAGQALNR